jgi:hypothetical protein
MARISGIRFFTAKYAKYANGIGRQAPINSESFRERGRERKTDAPAFARMLRRGKQKAQNEERTSNFGFRFSSCRVEAALAKTDRISDF